MVSFFKWFLFSNGFFFQIVFQPTKVRAETHRDVFEKLKMFTISPNCSLDHLEQAASNAKTEKKKYKKMAIKYSGNLLSLITVSILYIALSGVSHYD